MCARMNGCTSITQFALVIKWSHFIFWGEILPCVVVSIDKLHENVAKVIFNSILPAFDQIDRIKYSLNTSRQLLKTKLIKLVLATGKPLYLKLRAIRILFVLYINLMRQRTMFDRWQCHNSAAKILKHYDSSKCSHSLIHTLIFCE